jgi:hypothetical protein
VEFCQGSFDSVFAAPPASSLSYRRQSLVPLQPEKLSHYSNFQNSSFYEARTASKRFTMADAPEVMVDKGIEVSDKPQLNASSTDVSKTKYSLDGVDDGEGGDDIYAQANPARPGFTKSDQKDMWRMGRIQEFKVR